MRHNFFLSTLAAVAAMMVIASAGSAHAQCPPACTYHVSILCDMLPECFPLKLTTGWHCLNPIDQETRTIESCGEFDFPTVGPCKPVPCDLLWASLDGGATIAVPNGPPVSYTCPEGSTLCLTLTQLPDGCSKITIRPGTCN